MSKAEHRVQRAIKRLPRKDRVRYAEEWQRDLRDAKAYGPEAEAAAADGALRMATHVRSMWLGSLLLGDLGAVWAVIGWLVLVLWAVAAFCLGGIVVFLGLVIVVAAAFFLSRVGVHTWWSYTAMVVSVIVGTLSATFVWWVAGLKIDAADAMTPEPGIAQWGGTAVVMTGVSVAVFIAAVTFAMVRQGRLQPVR